MCAILCLPFALRFTIFDYPPCSIIEQGFLCSNFICNFKQQQKRLSRESFIYVGFYYALRTLVAWGPR